MKHAGDRGTVLTAALVFITSAVVTVAWCGSMADMPAMQMPGGWRMSMTWMRMPGQGWVEFAGSFLGMWSVMMVAMMVPALAPVLARHRRVVAPNGAALTLIVAVAYFAVWMLAGVLLFPLGLAFAEWTMRAPTVAEAAPILGALVVTAAGLWQFTRSKARQLACCRPSIVCCEPRATVAGAWHLGARLGSRCVYCCANLTAVLLVIGVMDLLAMALVTIAISAERLIPERKRASRVIGVVLLVVGGGMGFQSLEKVPTTSASAIELSMAAASTSLASASSGRSSRSTFSANSRKR